MSLMMAVFNAPWQLTFGDTIPVASTVDPAQYWPGFGGAATLPQSRSFFF